MARISQRQQSLILFVALFSGLMTSMLALRTELLSQPMQFEGMLLAFPMASMALTFLNLKYEKLISILRSYLAELEQIGGAHHVLPSLNSDPVRMKEANSARRFHDWTCALIIVAFNGVALMVYWGVGPVPHPWLGWVVLIATLACVLVHLGMGRYHYKVKA